MLTELRHDRGSQGSFPGNGELHSQELQTAEIRNRCDSETVYRALAEGIWMWSTTKDLRTLHLIFHPISGSCISDET